jgi:hypothetical protein
MARAVGPPGPATGRVTICHGDHGRHGACHVHRRVTTPGHGGHGAGHGIHGPVTATTVTEGGQQVRYPWRRRLSPGRSGGTKAEDHFADLVLPLPDEELNGAPDICGKLHFFSENVVIFLIFFF